MTVSTDFNKIRVASTIATIQRDTGADPETARLLFHHRYGSSMALTGAELQYCDAWEDAYAKAKAAQAVEGIFGSERIERESNIDWDNLDAQRARHNGGSAPSSRHFERTRPEMAQQSVGAASSAEGLKAMIFEAFKYVVPGILVEGLTLFAGKPKIGKSWLLLHAAIAVARGGFTLGELHCIEGDVLYCALEDSPRRLQSRLTKLLGISQEWPKQLFYYCELPRLSLGGLDAIRNWITSKPNPRLVIIDTLAMVRAPKKRDESTYDADYAAVLELRKLASEFGIAIVVVHHLRKADADDAFDTISGTLGLTGAPDTILVLKRDASGMFVLHGKGRDPIEIEKAMEFDGEACTWRMTGDATATRRSAERQAVLDAVAEAGEPIGPNDIAAATGMRAGNVRRLLGKLVNEGAIQKASYGRYTWGKTVTA
jgi:hypothetical protein